MTPHLRWLWQSGRMLTSMLCVSLLSFLCAPAYSQPTRIHHALTQAQQHVQNAQKDATSSADDRNRALSVPLSIFPGALVHGMGHFVEGETDTGWTLLATQGIGLGMMVGGGVGLGLTGASPRYTSPLALTVIGGTGLFASSFLADVYGVAAGPDGTGSPLLVDPWLDVRAGYQHVYDPVFPHTHFADLDILARWNRFALRAHHMQGIDDSNRRTRLTAQWKFFGPRARTWNDQEGSLTRPKDASHITLEAGLVTHRFNTQGFTETTVETSVLSRLDLNRLDPNLNGSFFDAHLGFATGIYSYDNLSSDPTELLLGGVGFGFYLGDDPKEWGEMSIYYDHRHDGFAAGAIIAGVGSGNAGHAGLQIQKSISSPWGVAARFEAGSAYVSTLSLVYRTGAQR